jgi:hypothetical protein
LRPSSLVPAKLSRSRKADGKFEPEEYIEYFEDSNLPPNAANRVQDAVSGWALDMITRRAGYVKLVGQSLIVVLDWIQNKKHRQAAEKLCCLLNKKGIKLSGRLKLNLSFYVSKYPLHATPMGV